MLVIYLKCLIISIRNYRIWRSMQYQSSLLQAAALRVLLWRPLLFLSVSRADPGTSGRQNLVKALVGLIALNYNRNHSWSMLQGPLWILYCFTASVILCGIEEENHEPLEALQQRQLAPHYFFCFPHHSPKPETPLQPHFTQEHYGTKII